MKYPQELHLEIPLPKNIPKANVIHRGVYSVIDKLIKISRDPNHPRAGVYYRLCDTPRYDDHIELVLKRVYPQPNANRNN